MTFVITQSGEYMSFMKKPQLAQLSALALAIASGGAMAGGFEKATLWDAEYSALAGACLLYTSPSPRDGLLSRMPSSA